MIATSGTKQIALLRSVPPGWRSQAWLSWSSHWCRDRRRCSATPYTTCPTFPPACWCSSGSGPPAGPRRRAIPTALNGPKTRWDRCRRGHLGQRRGRRHRKCRQARPPRHHAASGLGHCRRRGGDPRQSAGGPLQTCGWSQDPIGHDDRRRQTLLARRAVLGGGGSAWSVWRSAGRGPTRSRRHSALTGQRGSVGHQRAPRGPRTGRKRRSTRDDVLVAIQVTPNFAISIVKTCPR